MKEGCLNQTDCEAGLQVQAGHLGGWDSQTGRRLQLQRLSLRSEESEPLSGLPGGVSTLPEYNPRLFGVEAQHTLKARAKEKSSIH